MTIDMHGAKPIDFTASAPDEVREELRRGGMAVAKLRAMLSGWVAVFFLVGAIVLGRASARGWTLDPALLTDAVVGSACGAILAAVIAAWSCFRWLTLKSQGPGR
jgi:hypothetical protein